MIPDGESHKSLQHLQLLTYRADNIGSARVSTGQTLYFVCLPSFLYRESESFPSRMAELWRKELQAHASSQAFQVLSSLDCSY